MNKLPCHIVKDLLPLFVDEVVSEDTANAVRDHLEECGSCREEYRILMKDLELPSTPKIQEENTQVLKAFKKKWTVKKILISVVSAALAVFLFFPLRDGIMESELFMPVTRAHAGTVGQLYLGDLSDGEWTRLYLIKNDLFSNATYYGEPYLNFDNPFYEKKAVNSANSSTAVEMRILDTEGNVVMEPFAVEAGMGVPLESLEYWTDYIVEYRAEGDFYQFSFS